MKLFFIFFCHTDCSYKMEFWIYSSENDLSSFQIFILANYCVLGSFTTGIHYSVSHKKLKNGVLFWIYCLASEKTHYSKLYSSPLAYGYAMPFNRMTLPFPLIDCPLFPETITCSDLNLLLTYCSLFMLSLLGLLGLDDLFHAFFCLFVSATKINRQTTWVWAWRSGSPFHPHFSCISFLDYFF